MAEAPIYTERLRRLQATMPAARILLSYAATQSSTVTGVETTVDHLQKILDGEEGSPVKRRELVSTLRAFALAGCGQFFAGRHGRPSRFVWTIPLGALAAAVAGNKSSSTDGNPVMNAIATGQNAGTQPGTFSHTYRLRPDLVVSMNLPKDLTAPEADRLARFIQTLPLGG